MYLVSIQQMLGLLSSIQLSLLPIFTKLIVWYWDKHNYLAKIEEEDDMYLGMNGWEKVCQGEKEEGHSKQRELS